MESQTPEIKKNEAPGFSRRLGQLFSSERLSLALFIVAVVFIYFFIQGFLIRTYQVDGQSMETTLQNGDRLIINKIPLTFARLGGNAYVPQRGDIIVFRQNGSGADPTKEKQLIKRVIGLPGERVEVKDGTLTIYNFAHPDGYQPDRTDLYRIDSPVTPGGVDLTLGPGEVFVAGDNRNNSEDSRYFGPVRTDKIVGKLVLRFFPLSKIRAY